MHVSTDKSAIRHWFISILFISMYSFGSGIPDTTRALFERGAATYDTLLLKRAFNQAALKNVVPDYLFQARCLWRIQVVKFLLADTKGAITYGKRSLALLDSAELSGADPFAVAALRALASQILAGTGAANGAVYGPRTGGYLATLKKLRPSAFDTKLVEAFNFLEAPAFVGGSPQKATAAFEKLHKEFPDSTIVTINLARALLKTKRIKEADSLCSMVLEKTPMELWAKKVREAIVKAK
jgi:hypothetical protein